MKKNIRRIVIGLAILLAVIGIFAVKSTFAAGSAILSDTTHRIAKIKHVSIEIAGDGSTYRNVAGSYSARTPKVVTMLDNANRINVAYFTGNALVIQKYDPELLNQTERIQLEARYPVFGDVTCDSAGNYYAVWAQNDANDTNCVTMCIAKYNSSGTFIKELVLNGYDSKPYSDNTWGTQYPFEAGSCSMAIQNNVLAVSYARKMYNGHQSSMIIYADCATMTRKYNNMAYTSHSFDQRIYPVSSGGYLAINQGDAYTRGFHITKLRKAIDTERSSWSKYHDGDMVSFHFREGPNRAYGYNETFAQIGGMAEVTNGYMFAASSDRLLSVEPAPGTGYYGHYGARDLFLQILKKDFGKYSGAAQYAVAGETRKTTGTKPASAKTQLWLDGTEVNYGILWLTGYDENYYAANPHIVAIDSDTVGILWEKRAYPANYWYDNMSLNAYYAEIDGNGKVKLDTTFVPDCMLAADTDPVYYNGKIYWATNDTRGGQLHVLTTRACDFDPSVVAPSGLGLYFDSLDMIVGDTKKLGYAVAPDNAYDKTVYFSSSDPSIVSVDQDGNMKALKVGKAVITVRTINGISKTCTVNSKRIEPTGIGLYYSKLNLNRGSSLKLEAVVVPDNAYDKTVKWKSSDASVVSVDQNGNIKAVKIGTAVITASTVNGKEAKCTVNVIVPCTKITLNTDSYTIYYGGKYTLVPTLEPSDTTQTKVTYTSSNPSSVTVNGNGVITGVAYAGKATITAKTENGLTAKCEVVCLAEDNPENPFADVKESGWEYANIKYAYDNGYITGKGELVPGKVLIRPNSPISRAEFVQILYKYEGEPEVTYTEKFSDVPENAWYAKAVIWASDNGIVTGKGGGIFDPNGAAARQQIALMLYKYAIYKNLDVTIPPETEISVDSFEDSADVEAWAKDALNWALAYGIMSGKGTKLAPKAQTKRSEFATMLKKFDDYAKTADHVVIVPDVVGKGRAEGCNNILLPAGFEVNYEFDWSDTIPEETIMSQNPAAGSRVKPGSVITVVISKGPAGPECPSVVGMTFKEAKELLEGMGITLTCIEAHEDTDYVVSQNVEPGEILPKNGSLLVKVSKTKPGNDTNAEPEEPEVNPEDPDVNPEEPSVNPDEPSVNPEEPKVNPEDKDVPDKKDEIKDDSSDEPKDDTKDEPDDGSKDNGEDASKEETE